MVTAEVSAHPSRWRTAAWWAATLLTLVVLDDLTFGPVFWVLSRLGGPRAAALAALVIYTTAQIYIVVRATTDEPGRFATFFLERLDLQRRSAHIAANEHRLRRRVVGAASAVALSLLIGGVLPPLLLWRRGWPRTEVLRVATLCAPVYALEFAVLHGVLPALV